MRRKKFLAVLLTFAMLLSLLPVSAIQLEDTVFSKIASASEITPGNEYVIYGVDTGAEAAMSNSLSSGKVNSTDITSCFVGEAIVNPPEDVIWKVIAASDIDPSNTSPDTYTLYNEASGKYLVLSDPTKTNGFSLMDTPTAFFTASDKDDTGNIYLKTDSRSISLYKAASGAIDFRSYADSSTKTLYLYEKGSGAVPDGVAAPEADPPDGVYTLGTSVSVSLLTKTTGADIYYTLDGTQPDNSSTKYTAPVPVTSGTAGTVELKAVAVKGAESSAVSTFSYSFVPAAVSIQDALDAADGDTVTTGGVVTSVDGKYLTLQDGSAGIYLMFPSAPGLARGQKIVVSGNRTTYNESLPALSSVEVVGSPSTGALPSPETVDFTAFTDASLNKLVAPSDPTFTMGEEANAGFTSITQNGTSILAKLQGSVKGTLEPGDTLKITSAALISYRGTYELIVPDGCYERVAPAVEPVIADPDSSAVFAGEQVTLTCKTPDSVIHYKRNGGREELAGGSVTLTINETTVIEAWATKGTDESVHKTYTYYIKQPFTLAKGPVVIWEVYGGGGNSGAEYKNDYIVLKNISDAAVDVSGWSVQYASATNSATFKNIFTLPEKAVIEAGKYYLIQAAAGNGGTLDLPTPDVISTLTMGGAAGQIALAAYSSAGITGLTDPNLADFVGYGTAGWYLGTAGTAALDATHSARRTTTDFGAGYTPDNSADYDKTTANLDYLGRSTLSIKASPAPGAVTAGTEIKLSTSIDDAVIYYTTDGSDPTAQSTQYDPDTTPIIVNAALTIKAYLDSPTLGKSAIYTFSYTLAQQETIATARAKAKGTNVMVEGIVTYIDGSSFCIQDGTAGIVCRIFEFGEHGKPQVGDQIQVTGTRDTYNYLEQLNPATLLSRTDTPSMALPEPELKTIGWLLEKQEEGKTAVNAELVESQRIRLEAVTLGTLSSTGDTPITDQDGNTINIRKIPTLDGIGKGDLVNLTVVVSQYSTGNSYSGYSVYLASVDDIALAPDKYPPIFDTSKLTSPLMGKDYEMVVVVTDSSGVDPESVKVTYTVKDKDGVPVSGSDSVVLKLNTADASTGIYRGTIPADKLGGVTLELLFSATDQAAVPNSGGPGLMVKNIDGKPRITAVTPASNSGTGEVTMPVISAAFENAGESPVISMTLDGTVVTHTVTNGVISYTPTAELAAGSHTVKVSIARSDGDTTPVEKTWSFFIGIPSFTPYFGQMHAHTNHSDGAGTPEQAFSHARDADNLDFLAITDHSNMLGTVGQNDNASDADLNITNIADAFSSEWRQQHALADQYTDDTFVCIAGWEMTWNGSHPGSASGLGQSGAAGHMNTYNVPWIASRNDLSMTLEKFYDKLTQPENVDSFSQFNHPGTTFGDFYSFDQWSPLRDSRVTMIEVGNGEGAVHQSGYFPSYEYYTKALDKGWHLAPTNNQDNHKGNWGDSNTARTVALAPDLTRDSLYDAFRSMRVYATEDNNLSITYTANGQVMGSTLGSDGEPTRSIDFLFTATDPDESDILQKVELVSNGGLIVATLDLTGTEPVASFASGIEGESKFSAYESGAANWEFTIPAGNSYYYFRVTQADKDLAVTSPVWTGAVATVGVDKVVADTSLAIVGRPVMLEVQFYNSNLEDVTLEKLEVLEGSTVLAVKENMNVTIPANGSGFISFTPTRPGLMTLTVQATLSISGSAKIFNVPFNLTAKNADNTPLVLLDAAHNNAYVSGYYENNYGAFQQYLSGQGVELAVNTLKFDDPAFSLDGVDLLVIADAHGRNDDIDKMTYTDAEVAAIADFVRGGGNLILTSLADYKDTKAPSPYSNDYQTNCFLEAVGSALRVGDDELFDSSNGSSGNSNNIRLYFNDYNLESQFGLMSNIPHIKDDSGTPLEPYQDYSFYSGCSVYLDHEAAGAEYLVGAGGDVYGKGLESVVKADDTDGDGKAVPNDTPIYALAVEDLSVSGQAGYGKVAVAGTTFFSDFEIGSSSATTYSNLSILGSIVDWMLLEDMTVSEARADRVNNATGEPVPDGIPDRFDSLERIQVTGWLTTESMGETQSKDRNNAFFDSVYLQDETGGITVFGISSLQLPIGAKVTLRGVIDGYQGDYELAISDELKDVIVYPGDQRIFEPATVATGTLPEHMGQLIKLEGKVVSFGLNGDLAADNAILIDDGSGQARIFLDGYVGSSAGNAALLGAWDPEIQVGDTISAVGLVSTDPISDRIRVRDTEEIILVAKGEDPDPDPDPSPDPDDPGGDSGSSGGSGGGSSTPNQPSVSVEAGSDYVTITVNTEKPTLTAEQESQLVALNSTRPIYVTGGGLSITIPSGMLAKGDSINAMLVDPKTQGNVIQVTHADGSTSILPFALVGAGNVSYLANVKGSYQIIENTKTFQDVESTHWAADAVDFVSSHELFNGVGGGSFAPGEPITRGMIVTVLSRLAGAMPSEGASTFSDVPQDAWYADAVAWAAKAHIVEGNGAYFNPDDPLTREQLCVMLARFLDYAKLTLGGENEMSGYSDTQEVSSWATSAVNMCLRAGLINGKPGGLIDPQGQASRAEIAVILQRLVENVLS